MAGVDLKICTTNEKNRIMFTATRFGDLVKYSLSKIKLWLFNIRCNVIYFSIENEKN